MTSIGWKHLQPCYKPGRRVKPLRCKAALSQPLTPAALGVGASTNPLPRSYRSVTTDPAGRLATSGGAQYAPGPPQLVSRHITLNPVHGLVRWAEDRLQRLDLAAAAALDDRPVVQLAAAVLTAALTWAGLHPVALLLPAPGYTVGSRGLPAQLAEWLDVQVGGWVVPLVTCAALAAGLAAAAWQLRTWWAAQLAMVRPDDLLAEAAASRTAAAACAAGREEAQGEAAGSGTAAAPAEGPFSRLIPAALRAFIEPTWKPTDKTWLYVIMGGRLSALCSAAAAVVCGSTATAAAYAALCFGASLLPAALPHLRDLLRSDAASKTRLAAPLLAADAAFLAALAPATPFAARTAAAAVLAAGLSLAAMTAAATPRLAAATAADGDECTFHVTVRLPLSGTPIDSTIGHRALTAVVGVQSTPITAGSEPAPADVAVATEADAAVADPRTAGTIAGAVADPQARFRPLQQLIAAEVLPGMRVGEKRSITVWGMSAADAAAAGAETDGGNGEGDAVVDGVVPPFRNPGLVWWQPLDDLRRKLGSSAPVPSVGDVFWYPLGPLVAELGAVRLSQQQLEAQEAAGSEARIEGADGWGPVCVAAVSGEWVQLDGNVGAHESVEVEVELLQVTKQGGGQGAAAEGKA